MHSAWTLAKWCSLEELMLPRTGRVPSTCFVQRPDRRDCKGLLSTGSQSVAAGHALTAHGEEKNVFSNTNPLRNVHFIIETTHNEFFTKNRNLVSSSIGFPDSTYAKFSEHGKMKWMYGAGWCQKGSWPLGRNIAGEREIETEREKER